MKRTIIVLSRKGGVAKSTLSILLTNAADSAGHTPRLIDADTPPPADGEKAGGGASLSGVFAGRVEQFVITPDMQKLMSNVNEVTQHWYPLFDAIVAGNALIDFGANVSDTFSTAWDAVGVMDEVRDAGTRLDVVVPITTHPDALAGGLAAVQAALRQMEGATITLALIEKDGKFDHLQNHEIFTQFVALKDKGVRMLSVPRCISTLWSPLEVARVDFRRVLSIPRDQLPALAERLGMSLRDVKLGMGQLADWYAQVQDQIHALDLVL